MSLVPYVNLSAQFTSERELLLARIESVLTRGQWVGGVEIEEFEAVAAEYCGVGFAVAVGSCTDALSLALRALGVGPGDEVITVPNSFISTASAIVNIGATPVFVDVRPDQNMDPERVEAAITRRTRALLPVHLTGRVAPMGALLELARRHDLKVVEDAAQAIGSTLAGQHAGTFGHAGCFSAHPLKNLNAAGDAGFIVTADENLAQRLRRLRNNGLIDRDTSLEWGVVSRMDTLQAAILLERFKTLELEISARRANAQRYRQALQSEHIFMPACGSEEFNTFHTFVVQVERRDELQAHLAKHGIGTAIHYRVPIHLQPAARALGYREGAFPIAEAQAKRILSLPIHQFLSNADIDLVVKTALEFYT